MNELEGKTVLVTGGAGFLGSFVCEALLGQGVGKEQLVVPRSADYNLVKQDQTRRLFEQTAPDLVLHLAAAVGGIGANRNNPGRFFYENMAMGVNVLEEARRSEVEKVVIAGTTCSYPKYTDIPFVEDDLWDGYPEETNAPYGIAKRSLLVMAQGYRQQYGLNSVYLIPANLYGPRDNFDPETSHVIPAIIHKCLEAARKDEDHIVAWGTGEVSREFLYAKDAAEGFVRALLHYDGAEPVNLGTNDETSIKDLVSLIRDITGFEGEVRWDTSKPDGQPRRALDTTRARERLGFEASTPLRDGLEETVEWYVRERYNEAT